MKALFIWNNSSKVFLTESLLRTKQFSDVVEDYGIKNGFLISSNTDWVEYKENIKKVQNIYILVELGWDRDIFKGYKIGLEILRNWTGKKTPTIQFVSMMSRQFLFDNVSGKEQYLVKVFNHLELFDISKKKFNTSHTTKDEWNFYKNYALTGAGILDDFLHRLETIISLKEKRNELLMLIKQMKSQVNIVGDEVIKYLSNFQENEITLKDFIIKLRQLVDKRKLIYRPHETESLNISSNLKVMIVEDNKNHLDILKLSLSRYFLEDQIKCFSKGEEAIKAYEENPKDYNLVFVDLELLENNFYQPIQGLRILKKIRNEKTSSFIVITGLGRKGVQELLQMPIKKIVSKKQLYQYDTDQEVDNMLKRMIEEFSALEDRTFANFGPNKSYFGWEGFRTVLFEYYLDKEYKSRVWTEANLVLESFRERKLIKNDWPNQSKELTSPKQKEYTNHTEFVEKKFSTLLAHRLIVIYLASLNNFILQCDNDSYPEYTKTLNDNDINLNKGYLDRICLTYKKISSKPETKYEIQTINMFSQEFVFIDDLKMAKKRSLENIYLKDYSPDIFNFFKKYMAFSKEQGRHSGILSDVSSWTIQDLISTINIIFPDVLSKRKKSNWYSIVQKIVDSELYTPSIEDELETFIPNIRSQVDSIHQILD